MPSLGIVRCLIKVTVVTDMIVDATDLKSGSLSQVMS